MSLNIGTNFNYQGEDFLDSRQGAPTSTDDFKNWTIPVPLGFEACLNGTWYMWMGPDSPDDPELGHWRKRPMGEGGGNYDEVIDKLMRAVFKLEFTVSGGGTYEVGQSDVKPVISWSGRKESAVVYPSESYIKENSGTETRIAGPTTRWQRANAIPAPTSETTYTYSVRANYGDDGERTGSTSVSFKFKKYYGSVSKSVLENKILADSVTSLTLNDLGSHISSEWANSWTLSEKIFNCSWNLSLSAPNNVAYPIYILPKTVYDSGASQFSMIVGGYHNTAYTVTHKNLVNAQGATAMYTFVTHNYGQTGDVISIKFGA